MGKLTFNFHFKIMSFVYKFRDFFLSPRNILKEAEIKPDFTYLITGVVMEATRLLPLN